ncbi:MAG: tRNA (guanosine(46)-N7)-methyltransferase TrmB [Cyclobacteriaceae bacterium]
MRNKLVRFKDNEVITNVIQEGKELFTTIKGNWRQLVFKNENDVVLEVACGRGEYTTGLAVEYADRNFIGIDIKGSRIWKGADTANQAGLKNVAFLRTQIDHLDRFFEPNEVNEIWLTFPDPRPKDSDEHRRLTYLRFLNLYRQVMVNGGIFRLKTDNADLFNYSLNVLKSLSWTSELIFTHDLCHSPLLAEHHGIVTHFERKFKDKGAKIHYLKCRFSK